MYYVVLVPNTLLIAFPLNWRIFGIQKKIMAKLYPLAVILVTTLISCGGSNKEDVVDKELMKAAEEIKATQKPDTVPTAITQPAAAIAPGAVPLTTQPVTLGKNVNPVATPAGAQPVSINTQPAAQQPTAAGMNPPHGQPGHRCDIPVGSPLNSKPAAQPSNPTGTISTITTPAPATAQATTAPGMNPPHGQPGHRCDIPVGSPLNSKPAQPAVAPVNVTAKPDSSKN